MDSISSPIGIGLFVAWAISIGRPQVDYVRSTYGDNYPRRGWILPLFLAVVALVTIVGLVVLIVVLTTGKRAV